MAETGRTIVLIHGCFVGKACWDGWVERFTAQGHRCIALPFPYRDLPVEELKRRHPDPDTARLSLRDVLEHHTKAIQSLDEKPILIGHSFGGLVTQLLMQRGLGMAAVAIDSVPPAGVLSREWSFYRSTFPGLNPLIPASKPYLMTFPEFQYCFVNTLPLSEQRRAYDTQVVPESRVLQRDGLTAQARIDFTRLRPPLLMIAGEKDHIMPASLNRTNYQRYARSGSLTEFKQFPGRDHYLIASNGWEEVADYALHWATHL